MQGVAGNTVDPTLDAIFAAGPEPETSRIRAEQVLEAVAGFAPKRLEAARETRPEAFASVLRGLCAVAPFLVPTLCRRPALFLALIEDPDLAAPRSAERLAANLDHALDGAESGAFGQILRRFHRDELARITVREADPGLVPLDRVGDVLRELSDLAELVLARATDHALAAFEEELGPPVWRGADGSEVRLPFSVLGLGKLGGGELNYASDVDLIYVHASSPAGTEPLSDGPRDLSPLEYWSRFARRLGPLIEEGSEEGFLYRVDLDLRPEGTQGAIVVSSDALATYYDGWAAGWEKAAFMKARPVAGDLDLGWRAVQAIHPMIYHSSIDVAGVSAIRDMKAKVEAAYDPTGPFNVKTGAGGIRDVECVAQALQLLHGGRVPQVRDRSAPGALAALAAVGLLEPKRAQTLIRSYGWLRRVENRLQMAWERQTHTLPTDDPGMERLARTLYREGDVRELFEIDLVEARRIVRGEFEALIAIGDEAHILEAFGRAVPRLIAAPEGRQTLERLARRFSDAISQCPDPERALNNLVRFVEGLGHRTFYYGLLDDRPELVPRLVRLFASSRTLSAVLATNPELIAPIFDDPGTLVPPRSELEARVAALGRQLEEEGRAPEEAGLAALRLFQQRELVNTGLLDLGGHLDQAKARHALTEIAEVCLDVGLDLAREQLRRGVPKAARVVDEGQFLVVGLGKLGSFELGYGSDLDVIFLFDVPGGTPNDILEAQEPHVRLAQKLGWALQTRTAEGVCYEVDARLRPSGNQGLLVSSFPAFVKYHGKQAAIWERQALLRARPVAGHPELAERFVAARAEILAAPLPEDGIAEIHRIRMRMEDELAREVSGRRNLKTGRGGFLDVESIAQVIQLEAGARFLDLFEPVPMPEILGRIEAHGLLDATSCDVLRKGWDFLQRLSSRLRIVENRSIADLEEERADLDSVARALGYGVSERSGTSRLPLLDDYKRHTEAIRSIYREVLLARGVDVD
jgi:glutamate-ammonia-ligase adenylyltransferase